MWLRSLSAAVHNFCANPPGRAVGGWGGAWRPRFQSIGLCVLGFPLLSPCRHRPPGCSFCPALMALGGEHYNVDSGPLRTIEGRPYR